jgi:UDP-4-amino-4,6-dideoxy-N-acetyl-beta-L-altrosamine transaminase
MIPYGRHEISEDDIQSVVKVLRSDNLTQGNTVPTFEAAIKSYCTVNYAIAVNSATSALHISCLALGVGPGDIVWTTPITFAATANCAFYCGAEVDFVDIDPLTYNMSLDCFAVKLDKAQREGRLPKVVIPVHLAGQSCDMSGISRIARRYGIKIIEDASHAIGGKYIAKPIGCCQYSDITVFSFHPVKIITTGEGGMALTNDLNLANRLALLRSHGITRSQDQMVNEPDGPWYYEQVDLGFNYRMTDIQAALGVSQMERLDEFVLKRKKIALQYNQLLPDSCLTLPSQDHQSDSAWHLYIIRLKLDKVRFSRRDLFERLRSFGVLVNLHYIPLYKHPFFASKGFNKDEFPEAEAYYKEAISLPIFPALTEEQQKEIVGIINAS